MLLGDSKLTNKLAMNKVSSADFSTRNDVVPISRMAISATSKTRIKGHLILYFDPQ